MKYTCCSRIEQPGGCVLTDLMPKWASEGFFFRCPFMHEIDDERIARRLKLIGTY